MDHLKVDLPVYAFAVEFYRDYSQIRHETGGKLLGSGVIVADALTLSGPPMFKTDVQSVERRLGRIRASRARQKAAGANILDLSYVA